MKRWAMLYLTQKLASFLLVKLILLSEMIVWGIPKRHTMLEKLDNLLPANLRERYCLNPLGKVVSGDQ